MSCVGTHRGQSPFTSPYFLTPTPATVARLNTLGATWGNSPAASLRAARLSLLPLLILPSLPPYHTHWPYVPPPPLHNPPPSPALS